MTSATVQIRPNSAALGARPSGESDSHPRRELIQGNPPGFSGASCTLLRACDERPSALESFRSLAATSLIGFVPVFLLVLDAPLAGWLLWVALMIAVLLFEGLARRDRRQLTVTPAGVSITAPGDGPTQFWTWERIHAVQLKRGPVHNGIRTAWARLVVEAEHGQHTDTWWLQFTDVKRAGAFVILRESRGAP